MQFFESEYPRYNLIGNSFQIVVLLMCLQGSKGVFNMSKNYFSENNFCILYYLIKDREENHFQIKTILSHVG